MSGELRDEWLGHEHTQTLAAEALKRRTLAVTTLIGACGSSDDPKIRQLYQAFVDAEEHLKVFQKGK